MPNLRSFVLLALLVGCRKPDPRVAEARQELDSFSKSIRTFRDQNGRWPSKLIEAVGETCLGEAGGSGNSSAGTPHHDCLSDRGKRLDPWGSPYEYDQSLKSALVRSAGPDRQIGTRDDLEAFIPLK